ncbi:MAG: hypothetical protein ACFE9L_00150 [Candidatus Hodarchaeota archaeon]
MNEEQMFEELLKLPPTLHAYLAKCAGVTNMNVPTFVRNVIIFDWFWNGDYNPIYEFLDEHTATIEKEFEALGLKLDQTKKQTEPAKKSS